MKKIILVAGIFISLFTFGQVGIKTNSPDPSSDLTLGSTNKGFLANKVNLNSPTDQITVNNPATGLIVYNTGSGTLTTPGYYYWNGSSWVRMITANEGGGFGVGEERGVVVRVPGTFHNMAAGSTKNQMTGRLVTDIGTMNYQAASEYLTSPNTELPVIEGLRIDALAWVNAGIRPRFYNTTSSNITVSYAALSTVDAQRSAANCVIRPGYYSWYLDGNDGMENHNTAMEFDLIEVVFPNGHYYRVSITGYRTGAATDNTTEFILVISVKRFT